MRAAQKRYWREADARGVLKVLAKSGEKLAAFARRTGVPASRLRWWRKRLAEDDANAGPVRLLPVRVAAVEMATVPVPATAAAAFEVVVGPHTVRVPPSFEVEALVRLLRAIDQARC